MEKIFFTKKNLKVLSDIVGQHIIETFKVTPDINDFQPIVMAAIKKVKRGIPDQLPKGADKMAYLGNLNKEVLNICIPQINKQMTQKDQYDMTMPSAQQENKRDVSLEDTYERMRKERELPTQQLTDFNNDISKNDDNQIFGNPEKRFEQMMQERSNLLPQGKQQQIDTSKSVQEQYDRLVGDFKKYVSEDESQTLSAMEKNVEMEITKKIMDNSNQRMDSQVIIPSEIDQLRSDLYSNQQSMQETQLELINDTVVNNYKMPPPEMRPEQHKYYKKTHYITIDSKDRDLECFPDPACFQVKFQPSNDSIDHSEKLCLADGTVVYDIPVKFKGDAQGASIERTYKNIYSIAVSEAIFPATPKFIVGKCPHQFNGPMIDQNIDKGSNVFEGNFPYSHVHTADLGFRTTILDEPYILLNVKELEGYDTPYRGTNRNNTNALAKLHYDTSFGSFISPFYYFVTQDEEKKIFAPTALANLDRMTLKLEKCTGKKYSFGIDKMHIASISEGSIAPRSGIFTCDTETMHLTKITVNKTHPDYHELVCGHCLRPGNKIYLFNTFPCENTVIFNCLSVNISNYPRIWAAVEGKPVNFAKIMNVGDKMIINDECILVKDICNNGIEVVLDDAGMAPTEITKIGFVSKNKKGWQSEDKQCLEYCDGFNIVATDPEDECSFEIDYPFEKLSTNFVEKYAENDFFFIKHHMQVSYTIKIETLEKDYQDIMESQIIGKI